MQESCGCDLLRQTQQPRFLFILQNGRTDALFVDRYDNQEGVDRPTEREEIFSSLTKKITTTIISSPFLLKLERVHLPAAGLGSLPWRLESGPACTGGAAPRRRLKSDDRF